MPAPDPNWNHLFQLLSQHPLQIAVVCTGGGAGAIAKCFRRSGASRNFVDASIPYSRAASAHYLDATPLGSYASSEFAGQLAAAAFQRATNLSEIEYGIAVGVGLAAALPTEPANDVEERIHVAIHCRAEQKGWSRFLEKATQTRESAEQIADQMIFDAIMHVVSRQCS